MSDTPAPVNKWVVAVSIAFGSLMATIDTAIVNVAMDTMYENWPTTTSGSPGRRKSSSRPNVSSTNCATRLANARMEMPRMTPGMTSGVNARTESADFPGKLARSSRNAFAVPTTIDSNVTHVATIALVPMLLTSGAS